MYIAIIYIIVLCKLGKFKFNYITDKYCINAQALIVYTI